MRPGRSRDIRRLPIDANRPLAGIVVLDFWSGLLGAVRDPADGQGRSRRDQDQAAAGRAAAPLARAFKDLVDGYPAERANKSPRLAP
jgi:hypothetical protein